MNNTAITIISIALLSRVYHIANGCWLTSYCDLSLIGLYNMLILISILAIIYIFNKPQFYLNIC